MAFNWNQQFSNNNNFAHEFAQQIRQYMNSDVGRQRANTLSNTYAGNDKQASQAFMDDIMMGAGGDQALSSSYRDFLGQAAPQIRMQGILQGLAGGDPQHPGQSTIPELNNSQGGEFGNIANWLDGGGQSGAQPGFGFFTPDRAKDLWGNAMGRAQTYENGVAAGTDSTDPNGAAWKAILNDPERMQGLYETAYSMAQPTYYSLMAPQIRKQFGRMMRPENALSGNWLDWYMGNPAVKGPGKGRMNTPSTASPLKHEFGGF